MSYLISLTNIYLSKILKIIASFILKQFACFDDSSSAIVLNDQIYEMQPLHGVSSIQICCKSTYY